VSKDMSNSMTEQLTGSVSTRANVYFDGKCVSHTVTGADGSKKSVGVILPSSLKFNTGAPEVPRAPGRQRCLGQLRRRAIVQRGGQYLV